MRVCDRVVRLALSHRQLCGGVVADRDFMGHDELGL